MLSRSESDFTIWLTEEISAIKSMTKWPQFTTSRNLSQGCSFDVLGAIFDVLIDKDLIYLRRILWVLVKN